MLMSISKLDTAQVSSTLQTEVITLINFVVLLLDID